MSGVEDKEITTNFGDPGHETGFGGLNRIVNFYNNNNNKTARPSPFTTRDAYDKLSFIPSYTKFREPRKRPRIYNPYMIYEPRQLLQCDLLEMGQLAPHNDDVKYLATCVDCFTRHAWVEAMKTKTKQESARALASILDRAGTRPDFTKLEYDAGGEWHNTLVQKLLQDKKLIPIITNDHASFVER